MFKYLDAKELEKFFDKFEDEVVAKSGLSVDELEELSKNELNELLNVIFEDVVITKDNIHLYYEFMSDEKLVSDKNTMFLTSDVLETRRDAIPKYFKDVSLKNKGVFYGIDGTGTDENSIFKASDIQELDIVFGSWLLNQVIFGVKDTLKPLDEYIAEIKASKEYQAYISKDKPLLKCYSIIANGIFYFINKQFYYLNNDDKLELVSSENKINELWELRKKSTEWELVTGILLKSLNKHISSKLA